MPGSLSGYMCGLVTTAVTTMSAHRSSGRVKTQAQVTIIKGRNVQDHQREVEC